MEDKFILIGLKDENSKEVAEVLSNKTCRRILDFLAETREASETDIADSLRAPINTVEYNIKKLIRSGLVTRASHFWSVKGKKIAMYKLTKKHIIISPSKKPDLSLLKNILSIILIAGIFVVLGILMSQQKIWAEIEDQSKLKSFNSLDEIKNFVNDSNYYGYGGDIVKNFAENAGTRGGISSVTPSDQLQGAIQSQEVAEAGDFSRTNIQVEGVDEPDIIKNDGKYIYVVTGNKVVILDTFPAENMKILSELDLEDTIRNIFISEDKLIVFVESYEYIDSGTNCILEENILTRSPILPGCGGYSKSKTNIFIYDVTDKKNPEQKEKIAVDGNYVEARMIDNYVYLISTDWINLNNFVLPVLEIGGEKRLTLPTEVKYFGYPDRNYVFNIVTAINIDNYKTNKEVFLMGSLGTIYVSQNNIYLSYQKTIGVEFYEKYIEEVIIPPLSEKVAEQMKDILKSDKKYWEKQNEVNDLFNKYVTSLPQEKTTEFYENFQERQEKFIEKRTKEMEKTIVHKIEIRKDEIEYSGAGEIPGKILNQFSMSEHKEYLRIATTLENNFKEGRSTNGLYILDEDMKIVRSIEDLAFGERIYSTRFIGDRAYMVTFKKIDPLFVIDLSDEENPEVLGYLKVTGYSDYLHPYDENHIIGIGKETREGDENFVWYQGLKISLFDVSDVKNPIEIAKIEIGERGTESYALHDHKAFLFDKEKNLLVIPISLAEINESDYEKNYGEVPEWAYGNVVWQGIYVLNISKSGIDVGGKITHNAMERNGEYWYWNGDIKRSLYMNDVLYTVSDTKVKANNLNTLAEISSVSWNVSYGYGRPAYETAVAMGRAGV